MKNNYKISTSNIQFPFLLISIFGLIVFSIILYSIASSPSQTGIVSGSEWTKFLGLGFGALLWILFAFPIFIYIRSYKEGLIINDDGLKLSYKGQKVEFNWEEIEKIGFQAIVAKRMGIYEAIPYLAIDLKDGSKITVLKSSREFGFLQKKNDLASYMDQKDVLDLYISIKFASKNDSSLLDFLLTKSIYVQKLKPLIKTNDIAEYLMVLEDNFKA